MTGAWFGFLAPKDTPEDIVEILSNSIEAALKSEKVMENFQRLGLTIQYKDSAGFQKMILEDDKKIKQIMLK